MNSTNKLAIIGYSCSVPGANDAQSLWKLVSSKEQGLRETTLNEIQENLPEYFYSDEKFINVGGGVSDYKTFDYKFFGYSPKEAQLLDPQIRKSLEHAWKAFEHAGYNINSITSLIGIHIASSLNSYFLEHLVSDYLIGDEAQRSQMIFLNEPDFLSTRIAYHFNCKGPAFTIKSGCSSSLVAIHQSCQALLNYECDIALSGGVAIKPRYHYGYLYESGGILSKDGRCCPFSDQASGTVFGNGIAFVVLKRLEDAIAGQDTIHGIISGSCVNNDGHDKVGYMAPSPQGQVNAMLTALAMAELAPEDIDYIETHGTGTEIGDPIEFKGLMDVYKNCRPNSIALGATKANVGHLDAASGAVGLIKLLMDLKHKTISPIANFHKPNNKISIETSPFFVASQAQPWPGKPKGRKGIVSSFGVGGTNAQVVIEEYSESASRSDPVNERETLITLSAKSPQGLSLKVNELILFLESNDNVNLADLSATLLIGRMHFNYRIAYRVNNIDNLISQLRSTSEIDFKKVNIGEEIEVTTKSFSQVEGLYQDWMNGAVITSNAIPLGYKRIPAPSYSFEKHVCWKNFNSNPLSDQKDQKILDISKWFYLPVWRNHKIPRQSLNVTNQRILLFADMHGFSSCFSNYLRSLGAHVKTIELGEHLQWINDEKIVLNPKNRHDFDSLMSDLKKHTFQPDYIFYGWTIDPLPSDFEQAQTFGLYALIKLIQATYQHFECIKLQLSIIASGFANISGNEPTEPNKSTLLGISQVLPKEYDDCVCHLIDIDRNYQNQHFYFQMILNEVAHGKSTEIALRGNQRYVRDYKQYLLTEDKLEEFCIKKGKNYVVIGGLGNFGMELSEYIGAVNQANVFLTSRTNFPKMNDWDEWIHRHGKDHTISKKILQLKDIINQGARVEVLKADVTNREDLIQVKQYIEQQYGSIAGVIHAAGIVDNGMIQHKSIESLQNVFAAKVMGTKNVCDVFSDKIINFIILCSSMNSIIGGLGQLDNTAANAFVDAYAEYHLHQGNDNILAINWGAVNEARARNYSATPQFANLSKEHIKNKMTKTEIFEVYRRMFSVNLAPRVVVSTIDFNQVIENWSKVGSLSQLIQMVDNRKKDRSELLLKNYVAPLSDVAQKISMLWEELLGVKQIGLEDNFFELGGNSLVAIQFIGRLTKHYNIRIHAMTIYEYPLLKEFARYTEQLICEAHEKSALMDL